MMIADMGLFVGRKIEKIRGKPTPACPRPTCVPYAVHRACRSTSQLGGSARSGPQALREESK